MSKDLSEELKEKIEGLKKQQEELNKSLENAMSLVNNLREQNTAISGAIGFSESVLKEYAEKNSQVGDLRSIKKTKK